MLWHLLPIKYACVSDMKFPSVGSIFHPNGFDNEPYYVSSSSGSPPKGNILVIHPTASIQFPNIITKHFSCANCPLLTLVMGGRNIKYLFDLHPQIVNQSWDAFSCWKGIFVSMNIILYWWLLLLPLLSLAPILKKKVYGPFLCVWWVNLNEWDDGGKRIVITSQNSTRLPTHCKNDL